MSDSNSASATQNKTILELALAWLVVSVPLLWGVAQTLNKALALFK